MNLKDYIKLNKINHLNHSKTFIIGEEKVISYLYKLPIKLLYLNNWNSRIIPYIMSDSSISTKLLFDLQNQEKIKNIILKSSNKKEIKTMEQSLIKYGLSSELIIDYSGRIISGNTRTSIIKEQLNKGNQDFFHFKYIDVYLIPLFLTRSKVEQLENILQSEMDVKIDYDQMTKVMSISKRIIEGSDLNQVASENSISNSIAKKYKEIFEIYKEFLWVLKIPKNFNYYVENPVYSILDEISNIMSRKELSEKEKRQIKNLYFNFLIISDTKVLKLRSTINSSLKNQNSKFFNEISNFIFENKKTIEKIKSLCEIGNNGLEIKKLRNEKTNEIKEFLDDVNVSIKLDNDSNKNFENIQKIVLILESKLSDLNSTKRKNPIFFKEYLLKNKDKIQKINFLISEINFIEYGN